MQDNNTIYAEALQNRENTVNSPADSTPTPTQDRIPPQDISVPPVSNPGVPPVSNPQPAQPVDNGNLYNMSRNDIQRKISDTSNQLIDYTNNFSKGDIVDKIRLKTGGVKDLDAKISKLTTDLNGSLSKGMAKYAHIIDFRKRNQLVQEDQKNIRNQISELDAVRNYRLGTIKDMSNAEISRGEQKMRGLQAQIDLYRNVVGDFDKADRAQSTLDKTALDMEKKRVDLKATMDKYGLTRQPGSTSYGSTDLTNLSSSNPNNASFKNNNPGNIKYTDTFASTLGKYGIKVSKGSGATDGGDFAKFNSIEDALQGRNILLFKTATYPNMTVDSAMKRYSNNGYGAEVTGVDGNKLMKDLTDQEKNSLVMGQLKREDPQMYKTLLEKGINPEKVITQPKIVKTGLSEAEKKLKDNPVKFTKYIIKERNNIIDGLKGDKIDIVASTLNRIYPTQKDPLQVIGRTLNKQEKQDIMSNIVSQNGLTDDNDNLSILNDAVKKYATLFYPDKKFNDIEFKLGSDFLDNMKVGSSEGLFNITQNLREKFNDQFN